MKKKLSILGILFATLLIEFPVEGFAGNLGARPTSVGATTGSQVMVAVNQPRRRRRRRVMRNGRWIWITYNAPARRYRTVRRYYYVNGIRRPRWVRVYY